MANLEGKLPFFSEEYFEKFFVLKLKSQAERFRGILNSIMRKNSLYNTLPIDAELFNQYMNEYVSKADKRQKSKRAACGNLNGS